MAFSWKETHHIQHWLNAMGAQGVSRPGRRPEQVT
nr:MAG TPA: hypothetical protein [Caudoviricetes sp.]